MRRAAEDAPVVTVQNRAALRDWLAAHHDDPGPVWLATFKKHHPDHLAYAAVVEELLCWGWIDSVPRKLDADRAMVLIAPRRAKSGWSAVNKAHVARAIQSGAMTPAGLAKVRAAQAGGQWDALNAVDALIAPDDLLAALEAGGRPFWETLPNSVRRGTLEWIHAARTAPTRAARIADVAESAAHGLRPRPFRRGA